MQLMKSQLNVMKTYEARKLHLFTVSFVTRSLVKPFEQSIEISVAFNVSTCLVRFDTI